jgi:hypothetical protein
LQLGFRVAIQQALCCPTEISKQRHDTVGAPVQLDQDAPSIMLIGATPNIASRLQSIDGDSQGAAGQANGVAELSGGDGSKSSQVVQATQVGAVHV